MHSGALDKYQLYLGSSWLLFAIVVALYGPSLLKMVLWLACQCMALVLVVDKKKLLLLLYCYEHNSSVLIRAFLRVHMLLGNIDCA